MWPEDVELDTISTLYESGLTLDALERGRAVAPLTQWRGTRARVLASRIAANAGSRALSLRLAARARREDPRSLAARVQFGYELFSYRGPVQVWRLLHEHPDDTGTAEDLAELQALKARAAGTLRDFELAEQWLASAERVAPGKPWIRLQRAFMLECADRIEESLAIAEEACGLHVHACYRPGIQVRAHLLQLLDRDEDAIELLSQASAQLQSAAVTAQLYAILAESDRWSEAAAALQRFEQMAPLIDAQHRQWLAAQRARVAYRMGDRAAAAHHADGVDGEFHQEFSKRLKQDAPDGERVRVDVTFVRQHFKTCAPATLAAIGRHWRMPAEHLQLAEAMCYDGTPHWEQRDWAERNGWQARDFRVTWEAALALLRRGLPFAIATVDTASAHMMAVTGFDLTRQTLLLRDPSRPYVVETPAVEFFKEQTAFGPHGTLYLPLHEAGRASDLALPDESLCDAFHRLSLAVARHERQRAVAALAEMEAEQPESRLALEGRFTLANHDANHDEQLRCASRLLELSPDNPARVLRQSWCLRDASRQERLDFIGRYCAGKSPDAILLVELVRLLREDARQLPEAHRLVGRAMRQRSADSAVICAAADLQWDEARYDEATELYRFAATVEGFREHLYQAWFSACHRIRKGGEALAHLEDRFARFGARSDQPALTLAWAHAQLNQPREAGTAMDKAIALRPESGQLRMRAAALHADRGEVDKARQLLDSARGLVREGEWLRAALGIAEATLDFQSALESARSLLKDEPLAIDVHRSLAYALWRREGPATALEHLVLACSQHPHHVGLLQLRAEWSRNLGAADREAAVRALLEIEGANGWALRELSLVLCRQHRHAEAVAAAREAVSIEPRHTSSASILGRCLAGLGERDAARRELRRGIELSVDNDDAIDQLLELCVGDGERREVLAWVESQLVQQVVAGNGLLTFAARARPVLEGEALLAVLRHAHDERPDLWHAWSALIQQLGHMGRSGNALQVAREATVRFPHLPRMWLDLALCHGWLDDLEQEIEATRRATEVGGDWSDAAIALSDALARAGRLPEAQEVVERALQRMPRDAALNAHHGHLLWRLRRHDEAFAAVERALRSVPDYAWPWNLMVEWSTQLQQRHRIEELARSLIAGRPGDPRGWLMLAEAGDVPNEEKIAAAVRAIQIDSRQLESWDRKAEALAAAERFDEAIATCEEGAAHVDVDRYQLAGRAAWVHAQRKRFDQAIRRMRAVVAENAGYLWGWRQLWHWQQESGDLAGAAESLQAVRLLRPHDGWVARELGLLKLRQEDQQGAENAFREALDVSPEDLPSAHHLFDLQLGRGSLPAAANTLRIMQLHQPGSATLAAALTLRLREGNAREALDHLRELTLSADQDPWPFNKAIEAFRAESRDGSALRVLRRAVREGRNPECAVAVVNLLCAQRRFYSAAAFYLRLGSPQMRKRCVGPLLQSLAHGDKHLLASLLSRLRYKELREDDMAWAYVGYALMERRRMKTMVQWMADWKVRPNVQPWMLFNYCVALRCIGRQDEAHLTASHALEQMHHRDGAAYMHVLLGTELALRKEPEAAVLHLDLAEKGKCTSYDRQLIVIARSVVRLLQEPRESRPGLWSAIRMDLANAFPLYMTFRAMPDVRICLRRARAIFTEQGAASRAKWWFTWRLHWQWAVIPAAVAGLAVLIDTPLEALARLGFLLMIAAFIGDRLRRI